MRHFRRLRMSTIVRPKHQIAVGARIQGRHSVRLLAEFGLARVRPGLLELFTDRHFGVRLLPSINRVQILAHGSGRLSLARVQNLVDLRILSRATSTLRILALRRFADLTFFRCGCLLDRLSLAVIRKQLRRS